MRFKFKKLWDIAGRPTFRTWNLRLFGIWTEVPMLEGCMVCVAAFVWDINTSCNSRNCLSICPTVDQTCWFLDMSKVVFKMWEHGSGRFHQKSNHSSTLFLLHPSSPQENPHSFLISNFSCGVAVYLRSCDWDSIWPWWWWWWQRLGSLGCINPGLADSPLRMVDFRGKFPVGFCANASFFSTCPKTCSQWWLPASRWWT